MERILVSVHVQCINRQVVCCKMQGLEHLFQGKFLSITENDDVLGIKCQQVRVYMMRNAHMGVVLHFGFDETQQVLLVHAARVVNVRVDFSEVVEITALRVNDREMTQGPISRTDEARASSPPAPAAR